MSATASELELIVRARNQASATLNAVAGDLGRLESKTGVVSKGFAGLGKAAVLGTAVMAAGVAAGIGKAIASYAGFEQKMTESLAIMGDVAPELRQQMEDAARSVATTTTFSADQAAESYFFLASAGLDAAQSIAALPAVAKFAQAGNFDMARATDLATDAMSALGLTVKDPIANLENLNRVQDVLVKANTLANASVEQFSESLVNKAGPALRLANKDVEEGVGVLAVFADQGIKGTVAGDMLSRMVKGLQINANANAEAFERMGITVFNSEGNMRSFADITEDLTGAFEGLSDQQKTQALLDLGFTARQQDVIKMLIGTEDKIRGYTDALYDAGGMTQEVADKQLTSINAQWTLFKSAIADVWLELGSKFAPILKEIIPKLRDWALNVLPGLIDKLVAFGEVVFKVAGEIIGQLIDAIRSVVDWFNNLSPGIQDAIKFGGMAVLAVSALAGAFGVLAAAIGLLMSPVVLVAAAIGAVGFAFKLAYDNSEVFRQAIDGMIQIVKDLWNYFSSVFSGNDPLNDWLAKLPEPIQDIAKFFGELIAYFKNDFLPQVAEVAQAFVEFFSEQVLPFFVDTLVPALLTVVQAVIGFFRDTLIPFFVDVLVPAVVAVVEGFIEIWERVRPAVEGLINAVVEFFTENLLPFFEDVLIPIITWVVETFIAIWESISEPVGNVVAGIITAVEGVIEFFGGFIDFIRGVFTGDWTLAWEGIKDIFTGVWKLIKALGQVWINGLHTILKTGWELIQTGWETAWGAVKLFFIGIWDGITGAVRTAKNIIIGILNEIISKINAVIQAYNNIPLVPNVPKIPHISTYTPNLPLGTLPAGLTHAGGGGLLRHTGGPVSAGHLYIIKPNEEVFVPNSSGSVLTNGQAGRSGSTQPIYITLELDGRQMAQLVLDENARELSRNGVLR